MAVGKQTRQQVFDRDGNACVFCGDTENLTIDHKKPLSKGGKNNIGNLQTLCLECNGLKGNREWVDKNPEKILQKKKLPKTNNSLDGATPVQVKPKSISAGDRTKGNTEISSVSIKTTGKVSHRSKPTIQLKFAEPIKKQIPFSEWGNKLKKKYPYAYSLIDKNMWAWIYDNVVAKAP